MQTRNATFHNRVLRYLALGDSYTIGEGVSPADRFPMQLTRRLRERGMEMGDPEIIARTGWTTDELAQAIDAANPQGPFDLVTLLVGVNNQYRGRTAEAYRPEFEPLLRRAIAFAGNRPERVMVVSIPDWGVTPFGRDHKNVDVEIDAFNAVNREQAEQLGVWYADITPISREALNDPTLVTGDGLHPSGEMYTRWVELLMPLAVKALQD